MEHFFYKIQGWFTYPNFYRSAVLQAKDGFHFVEIGSWKGSSAAFMGVEILNSGKKIQFDCVDTWEGSVEHKTDKTSQFYEPLLETKDALYEVFLKNIEPLKDIITPKRAPSVEGAKLYADDTLNFVFIDAAHDYENVFKDVKAWLPKVKQGGVLAGHDIHDEGIQKAVADVLGDFKTTEEDVWYYKKK
jgi:hypothetical protein